LKSARESAKLQQPKYEEEEKFDPEVKYVSLIKDLMESTEKPRNLVITALKSCDWDPDKALLELMKD